MRVALLAGLTLLATVAAAEPEPGAAFADRRDGLENRGREAGGTNESEAAVDRGLAYLARKQKLPSGHWVFDGSSAPDTVASTGMCLLPFLGAGHTHRGDSPYAKGVDAGLKYLIDRQKPTGDFTGASSMYTTGIAAVAVCEAYGMTRDPALKRPAQSAVTFVVRAQAKNGSWGYTAGSDGDTSITGWQVQALAAARAAGLMVPDAVLRKAGRFLDRVSTEGNSRYGYTSRGGTPSLTSVGLYCRANLTPVWGPNSKPLGRGVEFLLEQALPKPGQPLDMYTVYYATQVVRVAGGEPWERDWNPRVRDLLVDTQSVADGPDRGSWAPDGQTIGTHCGRLGTTCLSILTLEVYYRYARPGAGK